MPVHEASALFMRSQVQPELPAEAHALPDPSILYSVKPQRGRLGSLNRKCTAGPCVSFVS